MSLAAAHPERHLSRSWLLIAAAVLLLGGLFWADSPVRRWIFDHPLRPLMPPTSPPAHDDAPPTAPISAEASVVAYGLVDVDGGEVRLSPQVPGKVSEVLANDG